MQWLDFSLPFGWEELSAVATAIAVIVALRANRKTTLQMRDTLRAQEQSKNLELFDKRVKIIHDIEDDLEVSDLEVCLLFNQRIISVYYQLKKLKVQKQTYCKDLDIYKFLLDDLEEYFDRPKDGKPLFELEKAKWIMEELDYPPDKVNKYEELCDAYKISSTFGSDSGEFKVYNYKTISDNIDKQQISIDFCKNKLVKMMSDFVRISIMSLLSNEELQ